MKMRLTDQTIKGLALAPGQVRLDVADSVVRGLALRVTKHARGWSLRFNGKRMTLGAYPEMSLAEARAKALDVTARAEARVSDARTLEQVAAAFSARFLPTCRPATRREWERLIEVEVLPALGGVHPEDWKGTRAKVRETLDAIMARPSPYTANRTLGVLRRMVAWGVEQDLLEPPAKLAFDGFANPGREEVRTRVLTDQEIRRVWSAVDAETPAAAMFWMLAFRTGQRRGEILGATWEQLDLEAGVWKFAVKGGKDHWLGLPTQVVDGLRSHRALLDSVPYAVASRSPWLCWTARSGHLLSVQHTMGRLRSATGIDFRPHDIRRTVATNLGDLEVTDDVVSRVLSHSGGGGERVTRRVYNLAKWVEPTRRALQLWNDRLDEITGRRSGA